MPLKSLPWCGQRRAKAGRVARTFTQKQGASHGIFLPAHGFRDHYRLLQAPYKTQSLFVRVLPRALLARSQALFPSHRIRIDIAVCVFSRRRRRSRRPERRPLGLSTGNPISSAAVFSRTRSPSACDNKIPVSARLIMVKKLRTFLFGAKSATFFVLITLVR